MGDTEDISKEIITELYPDGDLNKKAWEILHEFYTSDASKHAIRLINSYNIGIHRYHYERIIDLLAQDIYNHDDVSEIYRKFEDIYEDLRSLGNIKETVNAEIKRKLYKQLTDISKLGKVLEKPETGEFGETLRQEVFASAYIAMDDSIKLKIERIVNEASGNIIKFAADLGYILQKIKELYASSKFIWHYFTFLNEMSTYYLISKHNIDPSPETFELGSSTLPKDDSHNIEQIKINLMKVWPDYQMKRNRKLEYLGWRKGKLLEVLAKNGIFDYTSKDLGKFRAYELPKFIELGITPEYGPNPQKIKIQRRGAMVPTQRVGVEYDGKMYPLFIEKLPRAFLEVLYRKFVAKNPDWERICRSKVSTATSIRYMAKRLLKIDVAGDKDQVCAALRGITLMKSTTGTEISEIAPELIMQPGGVQYLKYRPQGSVSYKVPESRQIQLGVWQQEVDQICRSEDRDNTRAYNYAEKIGLGSYIRKDMPKESICKILYNYIKILSEGRSL